MNIGVKNKKRRTRTIDFVRIFKVMNNTDFNFEIVDEILSQHEPTAIIAILQSVQEHYRYLPREVFPYLAKKLDTSEARIYSVATFYENFSLEPKGKYVLKVCDGTACHVRKSVPRKTA